MMALYEFRNTPPDQTEGYARVYVWAGTKGEAESLARSGNRFRMNEPLWMTEHLNAATLPFCTTTSSGAWLNPDRSAWEKAPSTS